MKDYHMILRSIFGRNYDAVQTNDNSSQQKQERQTAQDSRNVKCEKRRSAITFAFFGIGAFISGLTIFLVDPYNFLYEWKTQFGPGGEIFSIWEKPPVDLYLKVYLWNVTNSEEYMSGKDDKLKFQEVGPYIYREILEHANVTFHDNGTLTSSPSHPLQWEPVLSGDRKEEDIVVLPNIALLSIADVVSKKSFLTRMGLNVIIRQTKSQPLVQMTAKEFMFGYKSALMDLGNTFMPSWIYFDKLGLIDRMYEFRGDRETFYSDSRNGMANIGLLENYNGQTKIPQWESPCGDIAATSDGTKFRGYIKPGERLRFFRKSMCRAKELIHVNYTTVDGFNAYVYEFATDSDDNGRVYEKNRCFCKEKDINDCKPQGILDVRNCYYGFPIALSYPHFLDADKSVFNKIGSGVNPDPKKHKSYFMIEPKSGMPVKLAARYQINMALGNLKNIANSERFSNMILPLLWTEIAMDGLPFSIQLRFKIYLQIAPVFQTCLMYALFISSILAVIYSIHKFISSRKTEQLSDESPWIEDDLVLNIDRKLSSYIPDKKNSLTSRELEVYFNSLVAPLNQIIEDS